MQSPYEFDPVSSPPELPAVAQDRQSPNDPPWGSGMAVGGWIISVFLIVLMPGLFLLPYIFSLDVPITENKELIEFAQADKTAVFLQVIAIIPAHLLTLIIAWLIVTAGRRYSFRQTLGWESGGLKWWHYAVILGGFFLIAGGVSQIVPEQENDLLRILRSSQATVYVVVFMATFTAPLVEEVIYRGLLYSAFQRTAGVPAAFVIVTLMFALVHVPQYYPSFATIFLLTMLSVILTGLRVWTKNLWPCIVLHMLFNGLQSVLILVETYSPRNPVVDPALKLGQMLLGPSLF